jgi:hypothetical protein
MIVQFIAGKNGSPIAYIDRKVSFPPRDAHVEEGEEYEVEVAGENPAKTVYFLKLIRRISTSQERATAQKEEEVKLREEEEKIDREYQERYQIWHQIYTENMQKLIDELPAIIPGNVRMHQMNHMEFSLQFEYSDNKKSFWLCRISKDDVVAKSVEDIAAMVMGSYTQNIDKFEKNSVYKNAMEVVTLLRSEKIYLRLKNGIHGPYLAHQHFTIPTKMLSSGVNLVIEYARKMYNLACLSEQDWFTYWQNEFAGIHIDHVVELKGGTLNIEMDGMWIRCEYSDRCDDEQFLHDIVTVYSNYDPALQEVLRKSPLQLIKDRRHKIIPSPDETRLVAYHNRGMDSGIDVDPLRSMFPVRSVYRINDSNKTVKPIEFYAIYNSGELILQYQWSDTYEVGGFYARGEYIPFDHPTSTHTDSGVVVLARFPAILHNY